MTDIIALRNIANAITSDEVRLVVSEYYTAQGQRIRADAQMRSLETPPVFLNIISQRARKTEKSIVKVMDYYTINHQVGAWMRQFRGCGPVLSAGLLSELDFSRPYVGEWWSFAGLVPGKEWKAGQKRPFNANLKKLCFLLGESFIRVRKKGIHPDVDPSNFYGWVFERRKALETERNNAGEHAAEAERILSTRNIRSKAARKVLEAGRLQDAHINARARRYTVKLFLSHMHEVAYRWKTGKPAARPWIIEIGRHARYVEPPLLPEWFHAQQC